MYKYVQLKIVHITIPHCNIRSIILKMSIQHWSSALGIPERSELYSYQDIWVVQT